MTNYAHSSRHPFNDPPTFTQYATGFASHIYSTGQRRWRSLAPPSWSVDKGSAWSLRRLLSLPNALILLWVVTVYWSERSVFSSSINSCDWRLWESWPKEANPHRLIFIADPQLVDPHTYPGRPWPLSTLTVRYTDLYLQRVFTLLQQTLYPQTTIFLGDLFDGGREWSYRDTKSQLEDWKDYDHTFWLREYERFSNIFVKRWTETGVTPRIGEQTRRRLLMSLPGNHDFGFSSGIQIPIRDRFEAYFGEGNRVDIIGNHTFVSLDSVSLSAKILPDEAFQDIWKPAAKFLDTIGPRMKTAVRTELDQRKNHAQHAHYSHSVVDTADLGADELPKLKVKDAADLPTVLLTHVPLYREKGTPCGPLREHWPPSNGEDGKPLAVDERNAITVAGGYQYQNVLHHDITKEITSKIGNIKYAFSGDDHDYCDVVHRGYPSNGGIREITVKSLSWAMGVRRPGFVMASLWNPIDKDGNSLLTGAEGQKTMQTHLCLLPDQLGLFIRYALMLSFTLSILLFRAGYMASNPTKSAFAGPESPLLPTVRDSFAADAGKHEGKSSAASDAGSARSSHSGSNDRLGLLSRSHNTQVRSMSPRKQGGYGLPSSHSRSSSVTEKEAKGGLFVITKSQSAGRRRKGLALFYAEFRWSVICVVAFVMPWYFLLISRD